MARNMHPATSERQRQTTPTSYRVVFTAPGGATAQLGERLNGIQEAGGSWLHQGLVSPSFILLHLCSPGENPLKVVSVLLIEYFDAGGTEMIRVGEKHCFSSVGPALASRAE